MTRPFSRKLTLLKDRGTQIGQSTLDRTEKAVLRAALKWADSEGRFWPSVENWAREASLSRRGLQKVLVRLKARGLEYEFSSNGGRGRTNEYMLRMDQLETANAVQSSGLPNCERRSGNCERRSDKPRTPFARTVLGTGLRTDSLRGRLQTLGVTGDELDALADDPRLTTEVVDSARASIRRPNPAALAAAIRQVLEAATCTGQEGAP